jgi:SpoVK/Ycf46/Vps4 family AAA+-type ATPase
MTQEQPGAAKGSKPSDVPNRYVVLTKARLKPIKLGDITIEFKQTRSAKKKTTNLARKKAPVRLSSGAGFRYENLVAARFLLDMISATNTLGADFGRITRIDWQARDEGWLADDLALQCETPLTGTRSVGLSIKSDQQVTTTGFPADFVDLAWRQWRGIGTNRVFRPGVDAIALITAELPNAARGAWSALLSETLITNAQRTVARLTPEPGDGSQSSILQRALFSSLGCPAKYAGDGDPQETARLLHDIRLLNFDYATPTSQDRVKALQDCQNVLTSGEANEAKRLWDRLVGIADEKRLGGSLDLRELLSELGNAFEFRAHPDFRADWEIIGRQAREAMDDVQTLIANVIQLPRNDVTTIQNSLNSDGTCFLVGESGSGKSALAKEVAVAGYSRIVWLTANSLDFDSSPAFERAMGIRHPLAEIVRLVPERCLVVFDAIEAYPERALRMASKVIKDLLVIGASHVHLLFSVQFGSANNKLRELALLGVPQAALKVTPVNRPNEHDILKLLAAFPGLHWVALRPELRPLLTNLKILDWVARTLANDQPAGDEAYIGLTALIDRLWDHWTEGPDNGFATSHLLMNLAAAEADTLSHGLPRTQIGHAEQAALPALIQSGLIRVREERVSFSHDLLGDWARMRVLVAEDPTLSITSRGRAVSPRWQQAMRLFGQRLLERSSEAQENWRRSVAEVTEGSRPDELMRDLFLDALFLATNATELLDRAWDTLSANNGQLLNRLLARFLFVATLTDPRIENFSESKEDALRFEHLLRIPYWPYWGPVLTALHSHRSDVVRLAPYNAARVCALWLRTMPAEVAPGQPMPWRSQAAELALEIGREIQARNLEGQYYSAGNDRVVYEAVLYAARDLPDAAAQLCLELARRKDLSPDIAARVTKARNDRQEERNRLAADPTRASRSPPIPQLWRGRKRRPWPDGPQGGVEREFREACLDSGPFAALVQSQPRIALEVLLAVCIEEPAHDDMAGSSLPECGLSYWPGGDPPAYFRGPFLQLFRIAPDQALTFVIKLVNFSTRHYTQDRVWSDVIVEGKSRRWHGDSRTFRWHHDWPLSHGSQIQSSLMALEKWLYEQLDKGANIEPWLSRILAESESLAFAGLLLDVGKRSPALFATVLAPLFFTWEIWNWDFELAIMRQTDNQLMGYWGSQPSQLITLAQDWHRLPHRSEALLGPTGPIARTMLGHEAFHNFFAEVRTAWTKGISPDQDSEHLRLLIERITPSNYTFKLDGEDTVPVGFQWPDAIARKNEQDLRRIAEQQTITLLPWQCRKFLDSNASMSAEQVQSLWEFLQAIEATPPVIPIESGEPLIRIEDVFCGGIAVLLATNRAWLVDEPARIEWCRGKLQEIVDSPPSPRRFDSELAVGNQRWDSFAAECGALLLSTDRRDALARKLVAQGLMAFNYNTTALTMARGAQLRALLGGTFNEMITLSIEWAALRPQSIREDDASFEAERAAFLNERARLVRTFTDGAVPLTRPVLRGVNTQVRVALDAIHEKRFPGSAARSQRRGRSIGGRRPREVLHPDHLALDSRVMIAAFGWLDVRAAASAEERQMWLGLIQELYAVVLEGIPAVDAPATQEIDGLPSEFDDWVMRLIARTIPVLTTSEKPNELWQALIARGAPAHQWVERFFWHWFTDGLAVSHSPAEFVRIWREMIDYALASVTWTPSSVIRHELDGIVVELLCFDPRWWALLKSDANMDTVGGLRELFERAIRYWGDMPKVISGLSAFAVQPAAAQLLLPALQWIATAAKSFDKYDWKYGLEENVLEFLHMCWRRESQRIASDAALREAFLTLLATLVSRGSHAAIALKDRVAASIGA